MGPLEFVVPADNHPSQQRRSSLWRKLAWPFSYSSIGATVCALDCILIAATGVASGMIYNAITSTVDADLMRYVMTASVIGALVVPIMRDRNLYDPSSLVDWKLQVRTIIVLWCVAFLVFSGAAFALKMGKEFSRGAVFSFAISGLLVVLIHRAIWRAIIESALRNGSLRRRSSILLRMDQASENGRLLRDLHTCGFRVEHTFCCAEGGTVKDVIEKVISTARGSAIEELFLVADLHRWKEIKPLVQGLYVLPIPVTLLPDESTATLFQRPARQYGLTTGVEFQRAPLSKTERFWKRLLDLVCAVSGLILLMPMFAIVALAIKLDSSGPVLFAQTRHGFNSTRFRILKFRTMSVQEDGASVQQAQRFDARVTRIGRWLRRSSIDELPQLFNVLIGNMSIVGPRPHATAHDNHYAELISEYALRHHVKPGITGWAQIHGCRGETETVERMKERVDFDIWYVNNWNFLLDLSIILRTALEVVRGRNAY